MSRQKIRTKEYWVEYKKKWLEAHPDYLKNYRIQNSERQVELHKEEARHLRMEVLLAYGGKCSCPGCKEWRYEFLSLDHINNDGAEHRRRFGNNQRIYRWARRNGYPETLRVLCHNCNQSYGAYGYCPHEEEIDEKA